MSGFQSQQLLGNIGKIGDLQHTQSGTAVCNISVAVNERVKKSGEWVDHTEWFDVVCWAKTAENVHRYLKKGSQVFVEGPSRMEEWTDRDGNTRRSRKITANTLVFGQRSGNGGGGQHGNRPQVSSDFDAKFDDDDIPF